eukprot:TRINITY_DN1671_c0_g1_i2.p1 TRINITY_DN1671_c0_g1~~TRINITY_DN1671_c0_g1_i2.p1  ORF type:complete len:796 (-),score=137.91 TRINITY_DN1671_c0_g1_i2:309-2696(-)
MRIDRGKKAFVEIKLPMGWQVVTYMDYNFYIPNQYTPTGVDPGTYKDPDGSQLRISVASWIPPKLGRYDVEFFRSYVEEKIRSIIHGSCRLTHSSCHNKKHTILDDVSKWTCWKACVTTSEETISFVVMSRQYLPPLGNGAHIITLTLKKQDVKENIMNQFDVIIESVQPVSAQYNTLDIQRKIQNLEEDEDFYRWCSSSFHLRPFPRRCLQSLEKSLVYVIDAKAGMLDMDFSQNFFEVIQEMKGLVKQRDPSKFERQMSIYVTCFLDGGMNESHTFEWYCEQRSALSIDQRQNFDLIMGYLMHIPVEDTYLSVPEGNAGLISTLPGTIYVNIYAASRFLMADYFRTAAREDVYISLLIFFLRTNHTVLHLAAAEAATKILDDPSSRECLLRSLYIPVVLLRLVELFPLRTQLEYDNYPDEVLITTGYIERKLSFTPDQTSSMLKRAAEASKAKHSGYISIKEGMSMKKRWVVLDGEMIRIYRTEEDTKSQDTINLFQCTRIEVTEQQNQLIIHTLYDSKTFIGADLPNIMEWAGRIQSSPFYAGKRIPGIMIPDDPQLFETKSRTAADRSISLATTSSSQLSPRSAVAKYSSPSSPRRPNRLSVGSPSEVKNRRGPVVRWKRQVRAEHSEEIHKRVLHQITYVHLVRVIVQVAKTSPDIRTKIIEAESFLKCIPQQISSRDPRVIETSISLVSILSEDGEFSRKRLISAGILPALLALSGEIDFHIPENSDVCVMLLHSLNNFAQDEIPRRILLSTHLRDMAEDIYMTIQSAVIKHEASMLYFAMREEKATPY